MSFPPPADRAAEPVHDGTSEQATFTSLRAANIHRQTLWDAGNQIDLAYRGNELAGEAGEACNVIKKIARERLGIRGSRATLDDLAEELADVVICADLIAMAEGINLVEAIAAKFNATSEKVGLPTRIAAGASIMQGDATGPDDGGNPNPPEGTDK